MRPRLMFIATIVAFGTLFAAAVWSQAPDPGNRQTGKKVHRRAGAAPFAGQDAPVQ
jgi:hypothetical protein